MLELRVPATSANIGPGFDSLGIALQVFNNFVFKKNNKGLKVILRGSNGKEIKIPVEENLIYKSVKLFEEKSGIKIDNLTIIEECSIPIARGLGSSASAIAATLYGLNHIYNYPYSENQIFKLAYSIEGHLDNIIPALKGGYVINVTGKEKIIYKKVSVNCSNLKVVLVIPNFELKTEELRSVLPEKVDYKDAVFNHSRTALLTSIFASGDWGKLSTAVEDKLHQDYRAELIPGFKTVLKSGYEAGALGMALSGAGPTIIAFVKDKTEEVVCKMQEAFFENNVKTSYKITSIDNRGIEIIKS